MAGGKGSGEMDDPSTWAAAPRQALGVQVERGTAKRQIQRLDLVGEAVSTLSGSFGNLCLPQI